MREKDRLLGELKLLGFNPKAGGVNGKKHGGKGQVAQWRGVEGNCNCKP